MSSRMYRLNYKDKKAKAVVPLDRKEGNVVDSIEIELILMSRRHLDTGFKRNHIEVQVEANGFVTVAGERPLEGNRWVRFWQEFEMPNNCDVGDVRAKFQGDKLYVLLPKLIVPADDDAQTPPKMAATESPPGSGGNDTPRPKESSVVDAREEKKKKKKQQLEGEIEYGSNGMGLSEGSKMTLLVNVGVATLFFFLHCIWMTN
ncbi:hypothetical protein GW17_00061493 [Ensete ventricosum]|nr:hypothetical protein GW17_00061493 [Ensete ventricosum]